MEIEISTQTRQSNTSGMARRVLRHVSERSVLDLAGASDLVPFSVGGRERIATCSGVTWFGGYHLAVVNLYGSHLRIYRFTPPGDALHAQLTLLHELTENVSFPELVAVSPDDTMLALTHSLSPRHGISLHRFEPGSFAPRPVESMMRTGSAYHGVAFSPDSRHLAFTEIGGPGFIEVVKAPSGDRVCSIENPLAPQKPKSVAFTDDGRFVVIAFGPNATMGGRSADASGGALTVHPFDARNGTIDARPTAEWHAGSDVLGGFDCCSAFSLPDRRTVRILAVDQAADRVLAFDFDTQSRTIAFAGVFADGLSFPHAADFSADGRFVAMANYGDDTVCIDEVVTYQADPTWLQRARAFRFFKARR